MIVAPFLTWVNVFVLGDWDLFELLRLEDYSSYIGYPPVLCGLAAAMLVIFTRLGSWQYRVVAIAMGLIGLIAFGWFRLNIVETIGQVHALAELGPGPTVGLVASLVVVVTPVVAIIVDRPAGGKPAVDALPADQSAS